MSSSAQFSTEGAQEQDLRTLRRARAALSSLVEPNDLNASALIRALGPARALSLATSESAASTGELLRVEETLSEYGVTQWPGLASSLERWAGRTRYLKPEKDLSTLRRLGGGVLIPEDPYWPGGFAALGPSEPIALWYRATQPNQTCERVEARFERIAEQTSLAIVGARAASNYGIQAATELAYSAVNAGLTVVSGGAFGIDAAAHRAALAAVEHGISEQCGSTSVTPPTIAVMAGGLDRLYPIAHSDLLKAVGRSGLLLSEVPPGVSPTRHRFLQRNRLIAALCAKTIVIEAGFRSGALNTAHHAAELGRGVAAVPGSIFSPSSAGCHRLISEGAECISSIKDALDSFGEASVKEHPYGAETRAHDALGDLDLLLYDALPIRVGASAESLARVAGLSDAEVRAGLGRLELLGLAERATGGYRKMST